MELKDYLKKEKNSTTKSGKDFVTQWINKSQVIKNKQTKMNEKTQTKIMITLGVSLTIIALCVILALIYSEQKQETALRSRVSQMLYNQAMEYNPQMTNLIAEKVYLGNLELEKGDEALIHLILFYQIARK